MITKEDIERINFLSKKSREQALTDEEKAEQQVLRRKYIDYIKGQVKQQLENIEFVEDKCDCGGDCKDPKHHHHKH